MSGVVVWRGFYLADTFIRFQCSKGRASLTRSRAKSVKIYLVRQRIVHQTADLIGPKGLLQNMPGPEKFGDAQEVLLT